MPLTQSGIVFPDFASQVSLGRVPDTEGFDKFGYNDDIDTAAEETIWSAGGVHQRLSTPDTLDIACADANDAFGGTGAEGVVVYGVGPNRREQIRVYFTNGATITTADTWLGVNRMSVWRAGSGQANAGVITATATTAGTLQAHMPAGAGTSEQCFFFTQSGHTALASWLYFNLNKTAGGSSPKVTVYGRVFSFVSNCVYEVFRSTFDTATTNEVVIVPPKPFPIGPSSVFTLSASTDTNNTVVNARFSLIEYPDNRSY